MTWENIALLGGWTVHPLEPQLDKQFAHLDVNEDLTLTIGVGKGEVWLIIEGSPDGAHREALVACRDISAALKAANVIAEAAVKATKGSKR